MKGHILIVEDHKDSRELLKVLLGSSGFQVVTTDTLAEGLQLVKKSSFSLCIFDNLLPDRTEVELCKEIRNFNRKIPIVCYSGAARGIDVEEGLRTGAQAYLIKPIGFERLIHCIGELFA